LPLFVINVNKCIQAIFFVKLRSLKHIWWSNILSMSLDDIQYSVKKEKLFCVFGNHGTSLQVFQAYLAQKSTLLPNSYLTDTTWVFDSVVHSNDLYCFD